jgi:hypothetical protein
MKITKNRVVEQAKKCVEETFREIDQELRKQQVEIRQALNQSYESERWRRENPPRSVCSEIWEFITWPLVKLYDLLKFLFCDCWKRQST